ncbi:unnamed protein product, partial [Didymodactylos carnosus]
MHMSIVNAVQTICGNYTRFQIYCSPDIMCLGWADMYYTPRSWFNDFERLAKHFASLGCFHE